MFHHGNPRLKPAAIMGRESSGEVVPVGRNVHRFDVGGRVCIGADVPCGECAFCQAGIGNNSQINYAMGYQFPESFAEYALLNRTVVNYGPIHKFPDHVSFEEAALAELLGCLRLDGTLHLVYRGTPLAYRTISVKKLRSRTVKKPATRKRKTKAEPSAVSRPSNSPWGQNGTLMFAETRKKK